MNDVPEGARAMIGPDEALRLVLENARALEEEAAPLAESLGRVLARDLRASQDLPPFDGSAMDGFAVRTQDCLTAAPAAPVTLRVRETLRAGHRARLGLEAGEAARIMTGAPLPPGADAVVPQEVADADARGCVRLTRAPAAGEHVRRHGEDVQAGRLILAKGARVRPYEVALLAAQGQASVPVARRPAVSVLATGDELAEPSAGLTHGMIRDSNGPALAAAVSRWGAVPLPQGTAPDEPAALREALERSLRACDVLLVSGGVSVGDFDLTKAALAELGFQEIFWRVAIKPGKPLLFGLCARRLVFGLPGNPVAALVCVEEFVRPALERLQGHAPRHPSYHLSGKARNDYPAAPDRRHYLFCRAERDGAGYGLEILRPQGSAMLGMACRANALALAPDGASRIRGGDELLFRWLK
ncbi:MAG: molybdopterin molybdotransferase MoeA [Elusimicrobia bacterium]|nr:molybdopterin molybdotransferase MoeA [Elusimicrobiota bacterium]